MGRMSRTLSQMAVSRCSTTSRGAAGFALAANDGAGSARRSTFPLGDNGKASIIVNAAGTMYSGSVASRCCRNLSTQTGSAPDGTR